jgi:hypothetical protein
MWLFLCGGTALQECTCHHPDAIDSLVRNDQNPTLHPRLHLVVVYVTDVDSWFGGFMSRDDKDTVYCNVQMTMAQGRELLLLVAELRASGIHPGLASVFDEIQHELNSSIEFVSEQLAGTGG